MTDVQEALYSEGVSLDTPEPKGPPKLAGPPSETKEEEVCEQRPEAAKKAKPTTPPEDLRTPATNDWINMPARKRMGIPEEEDIGMIHM